MAADFAPRKALVGFVLLTLVAFPACELEEMLLTEPENVLVAEALLYVGDGEDQITALLHWTLGSDPKVDLTQATVRLEGEDGVPVDLIPGGMDSCLVSGGPPDWDGTCFVAPPPAEGLFHPGETVTIDISLPDGRGLQGGTTFPGDFELTVPSVREPCGLPPETTLEVQWTPARGTWTYTSETSIKGIREALAPQGIEVEEDPMVLWGLSVSETDTTVVFPAEFLAMRWLDFNRDLTLTLQKGLPVGSSATVSVAALDRNFVNWTRREDFNPTGVIRIPSLRGDGIGVLGSAVRRTFEVVGVASGGKLPSCLK